jgi:hypothetical protein
MNETTAVPRMRQARERAARLRAEARIAGLRSANERVGSASQNEGKR